MGKAQATTLHALFQGISLPLKEEEGENEVCNEDEDQTYDNCTCCGLTNALGTSSCCKPPAATHLQTLLARLVIRTESLLT